MPKVTNPKSNGARLIAATGQKVEAGGTVEVDDATAESLVEQGWSLVPVKSPAAKKAAGTNASSDAEPKES
jgi:hypothetical protein